jgi:hypothetical protein
MSLEVPFLRVKPLSTPTYWGKSILSRLWLQTAPSFLCPKRVTLSFSDFSRYQRLSGSSGRERSAVMVDRAVRLLVVLSGMTGLPISPLYYRSFHTSSSIQPL